MKRGLFRPTVATVVAVAAGLALTSRAVAQQGGSSISNPRVSKGTPDLSGFWGPSARDEVTEDSNGNISRDFPSRRCGPNQAGCDIRTNQSADGEFTGRWDPNRPLYKPEHWDRVQELDAHTNSEDPIMRCQPAGVPRMGPPTKIVQTANEVIFLYAQPAAGTQPQDFRIVPTDGRKHDPDRARDVSYYGHSVGHWEGDTLVVDSVGFNDITWLNRGGYFHSDNMRVIERFRREGNILRYQITVEDPDVLLEPWVMNPRQLKLNTDPGVFIPEGVPCRDVDSENIVLKIRH